MVSTNFVQLFSIMERFIRLLFPVYFVFIYNLFVIFFEPNQELRAGNVSSSF